MTRTLLNEGANALLQSKSGETALHIATRYCHFSICEALVSHVHQSRSIHDAVQFINSGDQEGETAIHYACEIKKTQIHSEFEDIDIIKLFMKYEGVMSAQTKFVSPCCTILNFCLTSFELVLLLYSVDTIYRFPLREFVKFLAAFWKFQKIRAIHHS